MLKVFEGIILSDQIEAWVAEAKRMVDEYHWEKEVIHPWGRAVAVVQVIKWMSEYYDCDEYSQGDLLLLANGVTRILNRWEKEEKEPKIRIRVNGREHTIPESQLEIFGDCAEVIG